MFRSLFTLLIFSLSSSGLCRAPSTFSQLKSEISSVSSRALIETLNQFVKAGAPSRMVGLPGHAGAKEFIQKTILSHDSRSSGKLIVTGTPADVEEVKKFYQKDFDEKVEGKIPPTSPDYQKWQRFTRHMQTFAEGRRGFPVENIIWEKAGLNSRKVLVVSAHYDTISHDKTTLLVNEREPMPGANYNASGVAVALSLVKLLSQTDLNYTVQVVFLDWQGIGFHGSAQYARELTKSGRDVLGVINLEMLGQDSSFYDKKKKTGNLSVYFRDLPEEGRFVKKLTDLGAKMTSKVSFEPKATGFENSDNIRFWEAGLLCATFTQNWEDDFNPKFFQTALDTPETLNHETLYGAYQALAGGVLGTLLDLTR